MSSWPDELGPTRVGVSSVMAAVAGAFALASGRLLWLASTRAAPAAAGTTDAGPSDQNSPADTPSTPSGLPLTEGVPPVAPAARWHFPTVFRGACLAMACCCMCYSVLLLVSPVGPTQLYFMLLSYSLTGALQVVAAVSFICALTKQALLLTAGSGLVDLVERAFWYLAAILLLISITGTTIAAATNCAPWLAWAKLQLSITALVCFGVQWWVFLRLQRHIVRMEADLKVLPLRDPWPAPGAQGAQGPRAKWGS